MINLILPLPEWWLHFSACGEEVREEGSAKIIMNEVEDDNLYTQ